jgi:hypothetical protein
LIGPPLKDNETKEAPQNRAYMTSDRLHGNSILKIGCHYFWPGLIALPKNTLPVEFI